MALNGAIMQLVEMRENSMMPEVFKPYFDKVIETISECEASSVQQKYGYWTESHEHVYMVNGVKEWTNWYCSECDAPNNNPTDFCPNCGAKMER